MMGEYPDEIEDAQLNSRGRLCVHSLRRIFAVNHRVENGLIVLAFAPSPRRVWGEWLRWRSAYGFTCLATLAMLVTTVAVFPIVNAKNSYSPFFDQVRDHCATGSYIRSCLMIEVLSHSASTHYPF